MKQKKHIWSFFINIHTKIHNLQSFFFFHTWVSKWISSDNTHPFIVSFLTLLRFYKCVLQKKLRTLHCSSFPFTISTLFLPVKIRFLLKKATYWNRRKGWVIIYAYTHTNFQTKIQRRSFIWYSKCLEKNLSHYETL